MLFKFMYCLLLAQVSIAVLLNDAKRYTPDWQSLDSRPNPLWYDRAKIGIFIHWGVYSVPGFASEWFWWYWKGTRPTRDVVKYVRDNFSPRVTYGDMAAQMDARFFNATEWAALFRESGAKYVVQVSKHHDGFTLWPSNQSFQWNAQAIGPHRDVVDELSRAVRSQQLKFGLYYSLFEWFNPLFLSDKSTHFTESTYVRRVMQPDLHHLVEKYRPAIVWGDGDAVATPEYWRSTDFLAWLFNDSPVRDEVLVNDRWGSGTVCKHGSYWTCADRFQPGHLMKRKWENALTLDRQSWGWRHAMRVQDVLTVEELVAVLAETISCGGNVLINVGPTPMGTIDAIFQERLRQLGSWLAVNGEGVYESTVWKRAQNDSVSHGVWYTRRLGRVYAFSPPSNVASSLHLGSIPAMSIASIDVLGGSHGVKFKAIANGTLVELGCPVDFPPVARWGFVLRITMN